VYLDFFQLKSKPFDLTPDPQFFYLNENHREVLANLEYGILEKRGFIVITGEVGTGKTTHLFRFLERLTAKSKSAFIFNPILSTLDFFQYIFEDFGLETTAKTKTEYLVQLNQFLLEQSFLGNTTILVIDEGQNLSNEILEEIRLLANLETPKMKLLQIVLMGQPELDEKLRLRSLRQLKQRIAIRNRILPLEGEEVGRYIKHRLTVAGFSGGWEIFPPDSIALISAIANGIPRVVNNLCDNVLVSCYALSRRRADPDIVREVALDLEMILPGDDRPDSEQFGPDDDTDVSLKVLDLEDDAQHSPLTGTDDELPQSLCDSTAVPVEVQSDQRTTREMKGAIDGSGEIMEKIPEAEATPGSWERSIRIFQNFIDRLKQEND